MPLKILNAKHKALKAVTFLVEGSDFSVFADAWRIVTGDIDETRASVGLRLSGLMLLEKREMRVAKAVELLKAANFYVATDDLGLITFSYGNYCRGYLAFTASSMCCGLEFIKATYKLRHGIFVPLTTLAENTPNLKVTVRMWLNEAKLTV